jgi:hypothetical protein
MKLHRGLSGVTQSDTEGAGREPTPAEACCDSNIERINVRLGEMVQTLEQLHLYYGDRNIPAGVEQVNTIGGELQTVSRGVSVFKMSRSPGLADQALLGLIRPFNRLREAVDDLEDCCPTEEPAGSRGAKKDRRP